MYHHVVWLTDLSEHASACEGPVRCLAMMEPARVSVVYAARTSEEEDEAREGVAALTVDLVSDDIDVSARVHRGVPSEVAFGYAGQADLLVLGRRGRAGVKQLLGSTSHKVLRSAACSVMVVGGRHFTDLTNILCPVEVHRPAVVPIVHAARLAVGYDAKCTFLALMPFGYEQPAEEVLKDLQNAVHNSLEPSLRNNLKARFEVGYASEPSEGICAVAEEHDLLVMGAHVRSTLVRVMLGSVSERVAQQAPIPVLVARSLS